MAICEECNTEFIPKGGTRGRFCLLSCAMKAMHRNNKIKNQKNRECKINEYNKNPKLCLECNNPINYERRITNKFCSCSCSGKYENNKRKQNSWIHPKKICFCLEDHVKRRKQLKEEKMNVCGEYSRVRFSICKVTGKPYRSNIPGQDRGTIQQSPYINLTKKEQYYKDCQFKFTVYDYPDYFDLKLIEKHGWYSTPGSRRGVKNIDGVSRDHTLSISEGFKKGINPEIISHPANCTLMRHKKNQNKHHNSNIDIKELTLNIKEWDQLY